MSKGPSKRVRKEPFYTTYVHRDIKPENSKTPRSNLEITGHHTYRAIVFLAAPTDLDQDGIPSYPTTKLGDFGLATPTGEDDSRNPKDLKYIGTNGYKAAEQKVPRDKVTEWMDRMKEAGLSYVKDFYVEREINNEWPKLGSHTNVWGVGACIFKLIHLTDVDYSYDKTKNGESIPEIRTQRNPEYSPELRKLVQQCLRFDPAARPRLYELRTAVTAARNRCLGTLRPTGDVPEESTLFFTNDRLNQMEEGQWVQLPEAWSDKPERSVVSIGGVVFEYPPRKSAEQPLQRGS
ncbi:MAG: hypothetical protein Q9220_005617 [cf. Caloplaca sp. 1 TL-2023]